MSILQMFLGAAAGGEGLYVEEVFSTFVYEGNDGSNPIVNGIDLDGEGGMVWAKQRGPYSDSNYVYDSKRNFENPIRTDSSAGELTRTTALAERRGLWAN